jgi:hypothetical protein
MITTTLTPPTDGLGCGTGACVDKHNAAVDAANTARREHRRTTPRRRTVVYGELGHALMLANPRLRDMAAGTDATTGQPDSPR